MWHLRGLLGEQHKEQCWSISLVPSQLWEALLSSTQRFPQPQPQQGDYHSHQPCCGKLERLLTKYPQQIASTLLCEKCIPWSCCINHNLDKLWVWEANSREEPVFQSKASDSKGRAPFHGSMLPPYTYRACAGLPRVVPLPYGGEGSIGEGKVDLSSDPQALCVGNCLDKARLCLWIFLRTFLPDLFCSSSGGLSSQEKVMCARVV